MELELVPMLKLQRELLEIPRGYARFRAYIQTIFQGRKEEDALMPLVAMNPMSREHVANLLDDLLAIDAEAIAREAIAEALPRVASVPGARKVGLVVSDDLKGGWTNRYAAEYSLRFGTLEHRQRRDRPWACWLAGVLWSSEPASAQLVREAVLTPIYRAAYRAEHPAPRTLRERMAQEGHVLARAGCTRPTIDADDLDYTREIITPLLDETNDRISMECLFGDAAGRTLGFTPRGLSPWAGLALARHDALVEAPAPAFRGARS
jgi:hypothetical protein